MEVKKGELKPPTVAAVSSSSIHPKVPASILVPMAANTGGSVAGAASVGKIMVSAPPLLSASALSSKPPPPPLIAVPSGTILTTQGHDTNTTNLRGIISSQPAQPPATVVSITGSTTSAGGSGVSGNGGGLGSGKPKSFLALMTSSTTKKQVTKKAPQGNTPKASNITKTAKGQGSKGKGSPSNSTQPKKGEMVGPSRTSNRSIKRPRTYDEEIDDLKAVKPPSSKKSKGIPKITKSIGKKPSTFSATTGIKDLGRWRPTDDLMLISAVQQTNDLTAVHLGVNFSCRFTLQEVEERWHALLYSSRISQLAVEAMRALHPGVVTMALNNALWSQEEEAVLAKIPTTDPGHLEKFQAVLKENPAVFHICRTATSLHHHWVLMGHNGLLNNQKVDLIPPEENIKEFDDAEDHLEDNELMKQRDVREEALEQELVASDRQAKVEIMKLEEEIPLWRTVIDTGSPPDFGPSDYALFKGKIVEFRMAKRTITIGRSTASSTVDFDLSLEGPAFKISRRQASIQLTDNGDFMLRNEGRRPVYVSGKVIVANSSIKLQNNQVLEVASMSFLVLLNLKLAASVKSNSTSAS